MKIFITGITGFLGQELTETLISHGHQIATLTRNVARGDRATNTESLIKGESISGVRFYFGDLVDYLVVSDALKDFQPDVIIHLAAQTSVAYSFTHMKEVFDVNFIGVFNMAEAARREVPNLKKFIWSGSAEEYGIQPEEAYPTKEDEIQLHAASPYGVAKIASENFLKYLYLAYDFPCIIFRNANSFGRKHSHQFVIENIIYQMIQGKSPIKLGDSTPIRDFIFEPDLLEAYVMAAESNNPKLLGEAINITTSEPISIKDLAAELAQITNYKGEIQWNSFPKRPLEIPKLNMDNSKAKELLGWKPKYTLKEGLRITASYWMK
ncbi:MAG: NAD-dependent epimerase/dehydratase family protein [Nitrosarchaeum sp.]